MVQIRKLVQDGLDFFSICICEHAEIEVPLGIDRFSLSGPPNSIWRTLATLFWNEGSKRILIDLVEMA